MLNLKKTVLLLCWASAWFGLSEYAQGVHDKKKLTLLIYMADDEQAHPYIGFSWRQLELEGAPKRMNVLVFAVRQKENKYVASPYILQGHQLIEDQKRAATALTEKDMLAHALAWARTFSAERYGLILWSHYSSPSSQDSTAGIRLGPQRFLASKTLAEALTLRSLDFIGLDACSTATVELACTLKPYTRYLIAGGPGQREAHWPYHWLLKVFKAGAKEVRPWARSLVKAYSAYYSPLLDEYSLALFDMELLELLLENINHIGSNLYELLTSTSRNKARQALVKSIKSVSWKGSAYGDLVNWYRQLLASNLAGTSLQSRIAQGLELAKQFILESARPPGLFKQGLGIFFGQARNYQESCSQSDKRWENFLKALDYDENYRH